MALHVELHHRQRAVDGAHDAFELCVAFLEGGHVHDDAVNPQHLAVVARHGAAAFRHPAQSPVAVPQAKLHEVRSVLLDGRGDFRPQAVHLFGQRELGEVDTAFQKVLRQPARECGHRIADEQHGPVGVVAAAEGDARYVGHERAQALLAGLQLLLHGAALGEVVDEAHKHRIAVQRHAANGNADGHRAAIGPQGQHLAAVAADQATTLALQVALNVGVVAGAIGLGHQDGHVLAHQVLGAPAQDAFGRCVEGLHPPLRIDHHHAVRGRVGNGAQAGLALVHLQEHLPVAQADVDSDDQPHR